jgi:hypothetical protein
MELELEDTTAESYICGTQWRFVRRSFWIVLWQPCELVCSILVDRGYYIATHEVQENMWPVSTSSGGHIVDQASDHDGEVQVTMVITRAKYWSRW